MDLRSIDEMLPPVRSWREACHTDDALVQLAGLGAGTASMSP